MLMQRLFSTGIMKMGPSRFDPDRQVGVFNSDLVATLPAQRTEELRKFHWIIGEWDYENAVPATPVSPAYTDVGKAKFAFSADGTWLCLVAPDGSLMQNITYDPFSRQWIYVLLRGSYGILRSSEGWVGDQITFTGLMTMIGINCEWRMRWTRTDQDHFQFVNEEGDDRGSWAYIDEWRFTRRA